MQYPATSVHPMPMRYTPRAHVGAARTSAIAATISTTPAMRNGTIERRAAESGSSQR